MGLWALISILTIISVLADAADRRRPAESALACQPVLADGESTGVPVIGDGGYPYYPVYKDGVGFQRWVKTERFESKACQ
jgi:hypothetical protein